MLVDATSPVGVENVEQAGGGGNGEDGEGLVRDCWLMVVDGDRWWSLRVLSGWGEVGGRRWWSVGMCCCCGPVYITGKKLRLARWT